MPDMLTGQCLCGAVAYRVEAVLLAFYYCECVQCRKTTGSIAPTNLKLDPVPVEWHRGAEQVRLYRDINGRDFSKAFCITCGAGLPYISRDGNALIIPAGSLDSPPPTAVVHRQFTAERPDWATLDRALPAYDGFAPQAGDTP